MQLPTRNPAGIAGQQERVIAEALRKISENPFFTGYHTEEITISTPDTDVSVRHKMAAQAKNFIVTWSDAATEVYVSPNNEARGSIFKIRASKAATIKLYLF